MLEDARPHSHPLFSPRSSALLDESPPPTAVVFRPYSFFSPICRYLLVNAARTALLICRSSTATWPVFPCQLTIFATSVRYWLLSDYLPPGLSSRRASLHHHQHHPDSERLPLLLDVTTLCKVPACCECYNVTCCMELVLRVTGVAAFRHALRNAFSFWVPVL